MRFPSLSRRVVALVAAVLAAGLTWKPEISPVTMAGVFLDEGTAALVKGDIAFCQSILETGWFGWPNSPPAGAQSSDPVLAAYYELQQARARN